MNKIIRILGYSIDPATKKPAQTLEVRELLPGPKSKILGLYWTGKTYKSERAARTDCEALCATITHESNGHPAAWELDLTALKSAWR